MPARKSTSTKETQLIYYVRFLGNCDKILANFHNFADYGNGDDEEYFTDDGFDEDEISIKITSNKIKDIIKNGQTAKTESTSKKKKKKKKNKGENNANNTENTDMNKDNKENENKPQEDSVKKKGGARMDPEMEEFERKLQVDIDPTQAKIKPNISEEWIQNLRQKIQKLKNK